MRSLGVDVGGEHGKDLDVVVLDGDRQVVAVGSQVPVRRLRGMIETYRPDVVCIDGPPAWAAPGGRSRLAERELKLLGIQAYYTPDKATGETNPFYGWMRNALAAFRAADRAGFPSYRSGAIGGTAIEVFPHASATVLAGCLAPARPSASDKRAWRAAILRTHHVPTAQLTTLDHVDAALCALTGLIGLALGDPFAPGAPAEGRIVVPARVVPAAGYRRCVPTRAATTEPLITFCACGCGAQVRPGREFRPGHDRRLMVQLERAVGARAARLDVTDDHRSEPTHPFERTHPDTRAIHVGQDPDAAFGAVSVPIYQNSTFAQPDIADPKVWDYGRSGNPTRDAFERALASLEGGERCFAFASGMAAETTLLLTLRPGDHVVLADDVYGGTYRLLTKVLGPWGLETTTCDLADADALAGSIRPETRYVWVETPSNPLLKVVDIEAVAALAHASGAKVVVDNTFASPALQQPLLLGADVVVHSVTKYIGGHSDLVGGAVITSDPELIDAIGFLVNAVGAVPGPMDAFLALRGLRTLGVRMRRHSDNAAAIAAYLVGHAMVNQVYYPGLPDHPGHGIAAGQMASFGGMVSFLVDSADEAARIARGTRLFVLAESLGGVESLIELPGPMTHASVSGSDLEVPAELVRLSVGLEHPDDLIADLEQAFG